VWGFTGRRHEATGQIYLRSRYLDPTVGVFNRRDRLGVSQGPFGENNGERFHHPYLYGAAVGPEEAIAPTSGSDPFGLFAIRHHRAINTSALNDLQWIDATDRPRDVAWRLSIVREINNEQFWIDTIHQFPNANHAMRDGNETRSQAAIKWSAHISNQMQRAVKSCSGTVVANSETIEALALIFHAVQDHVAHPNFPTWNEHYAGEPDMGDSDENPTMEKWIEAMDATKNMALWFMTKLDGARLNSLFGAF
jgi:hypothetical protein